MFVDDMAGKLYLHVAPELPEKPMAMVRGNIDGDDPHMMIDDCLQFSLQYGVPISEFLLAEIVETIHDGAFDPDLTERTLGWISRHREVNAEQR